MCKLSYGIKRIDPLGMHHIRMCYSIVLKTLESHMMELLGVWVTDMYVCGSRRHVMGLWVTVVWEQTSRDGAVGHCRGGADVM